MFDQVNLMMKWMNYVWMHWFLVEIGDLFALRLLIFSRETKNPFCKGTETPETGDLQVVIQKLSSE